MSNKYSVFSRTVQRKPHGAVSRSRPFAGLWFRKQAMHNVRATLLSVWLVLPLITGAALAQDVRITPDMVSSALQEQGYTVQSVTRTLLGRARIVAQQGAIWREVVLDLSSGQILRDYAVEFSPTDLPDRQSEVMPRGGRVLDEGDLPMLEN